MDPGDPNHLYAAVGTPTGTGINGIYQTFDGGFNWSVAGNFPTGVIDPQEGRITLAMSPSSPQTMYAAVATAGINADLHAMWKTTDGGVSWTRLQGVPNYMGPYGDYNTTLGVDPANPNVIYAGGQTAIIRSNDGGSTWQQIDRGRGSPHADHHGIGFDVNGKFLDSNDGGIWRLDDPTNLRWTDLNGDLFTIQLTGIALDPTNPDIAYAGAQDNFSEKFTDSYTWQALLGGDGGFTRVDFSNPLTVYMSFQYVQGPGFLMRSDTGGTGLRPKTRGINNSDPGNFYAPYVMDPSNSSRLLLGTNRVYETLDRAENWLPISQPMTNGWTVSNVVDSVAAAGSDADTIYATAGGHVFVTRNHGATWLESNPTTPRPDLRFRDIRVDPLDASTAYVVAANFSDITGGGHVWMTSDGGLSWNDITANLPDEPVWTIAIQPTTNQNILYVGAEDGVYISYDLGGSWSRLGQGMPNVQVHQLEVNTDLGILAAATYGRGMWELDISGQGGAPSPHGTPAHSLRAVAERALAEVLATSLHQATDRSIFYQSPPIFRQMENGAPPLALETAGDRGLSSASDAETSSVVTRVHQAATSAVDTWWTEMVRDDLMAEVAS
jgi:photosystem II stability/assembly factor-like uncharacterized protein